MLVFSIGGQGDGKSMINAHITYKAWKGEYDPILRYHNPRPFSHHSNCALYFCHPPIRTIDTSTGEMKVKAGCKCVSAQKNGDLNPLGLLYKVKENPHYLDWVSLFFTEFHRWADSHLSMQLPANLRVIEVLLEYLIDESRKRHFKLIMDSQTRMKISNRIRDSATYVILCKNYAEDKESLNPALEYIIIRDLLSWKQKYWIFRPGKPWVKFYGGLFNSWETPSRLTQVELGWGGLPDISKENIDSLIGTTEQDADEALEESNPSLEVKREVQQVVRSL
ncbi:MAG TPA: hypothetical protein VEP90_12590 [Methylomirabilota bacterium]|nr:hypothetical protein [Methylomirabilota bacterium]